MVNFSNLMSINQTILQQTITDIDVINKYCAGFASWQVNITIYILILIILREILYWATEKNKKYERLHEIFVIASEVVTVMFLVMIIALRIIKVM